MAMVERRRQQRRPDFRQEEVLVREQDGTEEMVTFMMRDRCDQGIGAVYIGQRELHLDATYLLKTECKGELQLRLAWTKVVAKYVCICGFELPE